MLVLCVCVCVYVRTYVHIFGVECRVLWSRQLTVSLLHRTPTTAMVTCHNASTVAHLSTVCDVLPNSGKFSQESYIHTYIRIIQLLELALCANVRTCTHAPVSGSPLALSTCCVRYLRHYLGPPPPFCVPREETGRLHQPWGGGGEVCEPHAYPGHALSEAFPHCRTQEEDH